MCILIAEIGMLIGRLIALFSGRIPDFIFGKKAAENYTLSTMNARIIGFILMIPLPLALFAGFVIGLIDPEYIFIGTILEILLVIGAAVGSWIYYRAARKPNADQSVAASV